MASAFDILGVLSFAQGAVTVVVAAFLAFRTFTDQVRDNDRKSLDLVVDLSKMMTRLQQVEHHTIPASLVNDLARFIPQYASDIDSMRRSSWTERWRRSNEFAASLLRFSKSSSRLTSRVDLAVLESRLLRKSEAIQQRYWEKLQDIMVEKKQRGRRASL